MRKAAELFKIPYLLFYIKAKKYDILSLITNAGNILSSCERILEYIKLRNSGSTITNATKELHITAATAQKYEVIYLSNKYDH
jgi:hypothetical protein